MAWLCVNKDGQELICQHEPTRWGFLQKETNSPFGILDKATGKRYNLEESSSLQFKDLSYWKDEENLNMGEFYIDYTIELPRGAIEKLIKTKLSWEDEPVEI